MQMELANCTETLLGEIADKRIKRKSVAMTYALAMRSSEAVDWARVNKAIIKRWSISALTYIKELARPGKCFS